MNGSARSTLQPFLDRLTSRSALTDEEQQAVLDLPGQALQVQRNRDFVRLWEQVDHACLVVAGMVGRFEQDEQGIRQITALHVPGDMCDLHSVVQPFTSSALQALSTSTIFRVPHTSIRAAAGRYPALAAALWRDCMVDASILSEWVMNVGRRDAKTRVAHLICEMATRLGVIKDEDDVMFDFAVSQMQLADATALTAVHVNRTLQSLRADGLVEWRASVVQLPRWKALVALAGFDPAYLHLEREPRPPLQLAPAN